MDNSLLSVLTINIRSVTSRISSK